MKLNMIALSLCLVLCWACTSDEPEVDYPLYVDNNIINYDDCRLVWSEEFDYEGLPNEDIWDYEEGYKRNYEHQDYKKKALAYSRVENGKLILEAHKDPHQSGNYNFGYSSASLVTKGKKTFKYGRIDIAAKIPTTRGILPVFWMLPENNIYGEWPLSGEIDIMEFYWGNYWGSQNEKNTINAFVCTEDSESGTAIKPGNGNATTLENAYHLYSLVWKKKKIQILLDNKIIFSYDKTSNNPSKWPFDQDFHLLISLAVGGVKGGAWGMDETGFPKRMEIDYIRYYELIKDDENDEVEDANIIKNAGFESDFAEGKEPAVLPLTTGNAVLEQMERWYVRNTNGNTLEVDPMTGAKGSKRSLKFESPEVKNVWDVELSYPIAGREEGEYTFSFWMKTNKEQSPFVASITLCESNEDIKKGLDDQKAVWVKTDGTQDIVARNPLYGGQPMSTIYNKGAGTEWEKYSITVKLPKTVMIKFVIRPCTYSNNGNQWPTGVKDTNVIYWFDNFSFEKVD